MTDPKYNDYLARYRLNDKDIYLSCEDDDDYFLKVRAKCIPLNNESLRQRFPSAQVFLLDGYYNNLVVKSGNSVEVYRLRWYPFIIFGGHYQVDPKLLNGSNTIIIDSS